MPLECGDLEDYIGLFDSEDKELPLVSYAPTIHKNGGNGTPALASSISGDNWQNDSMPVKLEKIRAAFLNAKTALEVQTAASVMPMGDWLDFVIKLSPKNVQVTGGISFRHMLEELGPIDKSKYLPKTIPATFEDVSA